MGFLLTLIIICSVLLVIFILLQPSREEGLSGLSNVNISGSSFLGMDKYNVFSKASWILSIIIIFLCLIAFNKNIKLKKEKKINSDKKSIFQDK